MGLTTPEVGSKNRGALTLLTLAMASPLGVYLAGGRAAAEPVARVESSAAQPSAEAPPEAGPTEYCTRRFLDPIERLSGELPESAAPVATKVGGRVAWTGDFEAVVEPEREPKPGWVQRTEKALADLKGTIGPGRLEATIATVPDPVDSGLGYNFDTTLQALRLGMEERKPRDATIGPGAALYRDRSFLPWDDRLTPAPKRPDSEACRETTPGIMLFRGSDSGGARIGALLLVGETPSSGVHVAAMIHALEVAYAVNGKGATCTDGYPSDGSTCTRIVGPTFSGSAYSMRLAIDRWTKRPGQSPTSFRIVSGSATGADVPKTLGQGAWSSGASGTFASTVIPERTIECSYLWFLSHLGVDADDSGKMSNVAILHESGTEFGADPRPTRTPSSAAPGDPSSTRGEYRCRFSAGIDIAFPVHISLLRNAYEELDGRDHALGHDTIARATQLEVSLRERGPPLDVPTSSSSKTTSAQDIALASVLSRLARHDIRHVEIHATDIGDAIFLARKIRDVSPDVRLAFFDSDSLLLHPTFRNDLLGSLVVGPYPFLGSHDLAVDRPGEGPSRYLPFENALAEGTFNAMLAVRGFGYEHLREYAYDSTHAALPVWVGAIGRGAIVPIRATRTVNCGGVVYGESRSGLSPVATPPELCADVASEDERRKKFRGFNEPRGYLGLDRGVTLSRLWHFVYVFLWLGFGADQAHRQVVARRFARTPIPSTLLDGNDRAADLAIGRTKWRMYAAIRTFVFALAIAYMSVVYVISFATRGVPYGLDLFSVRRVAVWIVPFAPLIVAGVGAWRFLEDYVAFADSVKARSFIDWGARTLLKVGRAVLRKTYVRSTGAPEGPRLRAEGTDVPPSSRVRRISLALGIANPMGKLEIARTSFAQMRILSFATLVIAALCSGLLYLELREATDWTSSSWGRFSVPAATLLVVRAMPLMLGASPAAPILLCMACVYVWTSGRMARLATAHDVSRISPEDLVPDLVSTPIRLLLYPTHSAQAPTDAGFTSVESALLNSIWRPITGRYYVFATGAIVALPGVLFVLKPPGTIEGHYGTWLFRVGLCLCVFLIGVTLLQLFQYWRALELLLKRCAEHPIGLALRDVQPFARDSLDRQVSRSPNDLLRLVACVRQFSGLIHSTHDAGLERKTLDDLTDRRNRLELFRTCSLIKSTHRAPFALPWVGPSVADRTGTDAAAAESALGREVVAAARDIALLLEEAWRGTATIAPSPAAPNIVASAQVGSGTKVETTIAATIVMPREAREAPSSEGPVDALTPVAYRFSSAKLAWLRQGQEFVVTVVALLVNRHVRQFRYFTYTLTFATALLLCAVSSYPFQPYRLLLSYIWVITGTVTLAGVWVFVELDRNTFISRIAGTTAGKLTLDSALVVRVVAWAIIPLLGVAAAQYPEVANVLFRLAEPFARALR